MNKEYNFITADQFLKQPKEIQDILKEWIKKNMQNTDLFDYIGEVLIYQRIFPDLAKNIAFDCIGDEVVPLFTETQLRNFIEEKTNKKIWVSHNPNYQEGHSVIIQLGNDYNEFYKEHMTFGIITDDLLQAYWQVAIQIVKEIIK